MSRQNKVRQEIQAETQRRAELEKRQAASKEARHAKSEQRSLHNMAKHR